MSGSKSLPPDVHEALAPLPPRLRYRRARRTIYELLVVPSVESRLHRYVRGGLSLLILANVVAVVLETVPGIQADMGRAFAIFEAISVAVFSVEYLLRLWVAVEDPRYARPLVGRLRFVVTFFALVDLVAILPFFLPHLTNVDARFLRALRLVRLARVLKLGRYSESVALYGRILQDKRHELLASTGFLFLLLLIASSVMYFLEHEAQPQHFSSIPGAMWWGIITLTTIGYGDVVDAARGASLHLRWWPALCWRYTVKLVRPSRSPPGAYGPTDRAAATGTLAGFTTWRRNGQTRATTTAATATCWCALRRHEPLLASTSELSRATTMTSPTR